MILRFFRNFLLIKNIILANEFKKTLMKKTYLLWFAFLALLLVGCRNENFNPNDANSNQQTLKFRVVPKSSIPGVINELQAKTANFIVSLKASSASGKSETIFGEVKTDFVVETDNNGSIYYNFPVVPADSTPDIYNMEVKVSDGTYTSKIVRYSPSEDWLTNDPNNFLLFSGNISTYTLDGTQQTSMSMVNGSGGCSGNPGGGGGPSGPGGTNGPGDTGGGGGGNWPNTGDTGGSTGGGTGGTGGNGCGNYQFSHYSYSQNPVTGERYITGEVWINLCGETQHVFYGGSNKGNCNGLGSGTVSIPLLNDPCGKIKTSTNDAKYQSNITALHGKTSDSYESGFRLGSPVAGSGQTGTQNQILQNAPGTNQVDMKIFSNTFALMHSHYDGLFPIFSPGDILLFNQWVVWANSWNAVATNTPKIPINNLTLTLVTSNGNYLLAFDGTTATALPAYTPEQFDDLNDKYITKYLDNAHTNGNFDMSKVEQEFLKFVKDKMNMAGLKLYRVKSDGNYEISSTNLAGVKCP